MSAKSGKSSLALKLGIVVVLIVAAAIAVPFFLSPVVAVQAVIGGTAIDAKPGNVTVTSEYEMAIKSELPGRVIEKNFGVDPGKVVHKGDILVEVDPTDLAAEIKQMETDFAAAKKRVAVGSSIALELKNSEADLENDRRLLKYGTLAESEVTKQERAVQAVQQRLALEDVANEQMLQTFENNIAVKKTQMAKMTIVAPFDGVVSEVFAHPGDLINGSASIATLITTHKVVEGRIADEDFANIAVGQSAAVTFLQYGGWVYHAKVSKILPVADPATQRHIIHLEIADIEPEKLVPGITGEVSVTVGKREAKAVVPRRALIGNFVFAVENGIVVKKQIEKGYVWLTGVEILKGLNPGDLVITEDLDRVRDGMHVRTIAEPSDAFQKKG